MVSIPIYDVNNGTFRSWGME